MQPVSPVQLSPEQVANLLQHGSPMLLNGFGRLFGLAAGEQDAIKNGAFPRAALYALTLVGGVALGLYVGKKWPSITRKVFG